MGDKKENVIERAPTARSSCKECGQKIEKDALRFGLVDFSFSDSGSYKYFHLACAKRRHAAAVAALGPIEGDDAQPSAKPIAQSAIPEWLASAPAPKEETPRFATEALPPMKDGAALDAPSVAKLVAALHRETTKKAAKKGEPTLAQFEAWLGEGEMRAFAWRLFESWSQSDAHMRHKWLFRALTDRIDDAIGFKLGAIIERWIKDNKKPAAEAGLEALAESGSEAALMVVEGLSQRFHYKGGYNLARRTLEAVANARGLDLFELEDRLVPRAGLDDSGSRTFDLGGRKLALRVDGDLQAVLELQDKTRLRSFPSAKKTDDPAKFAAAKSAYETVRTELEAALKTQSARLELALSTGRRWKREDWEKWLHAHPLMKHLVKRLVWASYDARGELQNAFIVDEQDALMDVDLGATKVGGDLVGLVHPIELDEETRGKWGTLLADFQIIQPFHQLARGAQKPPVGAEVVLKDLPKAALEPAKFHGVMNRLGWMKGAPDYTTVRAFYKHFSGFGVYGIVEISPGMSVQGWDDHPQSITSAFFGDGPPGYEGKMPEAIPLADVSPVAISEVLHDVGALAAAQ